MYKFIREKDRKKDHLIFDIDTTINNQYDYERLRMIRNSWRDDAFKPGVDYIQYSILIKNIKNIDTFLSAWELKSKSPIINY